MRRLPFRLALGVSFVLGIVLVVHAAAVTYPTVPADRAQQPARLIDRTLRCTIYAHAGIRQIEVAAASGVRDETKPSEWRTVPSADAESYGLPSTIYGDLVSVSVGGMNHDRTRCSPARARVPLTPRGLNGGVASPFEDVFECNAPRSVLARVRATFAEPVRLRLEFKDSTRRYRHMSADGTVVAGAFAIRTEAGRPIAYADVAASGRARLFTAANCFPD